MTPPTPPTPPTPQDFQKARRVLPMTVRGDQGLREGEVGFVEGDALTFWSTERLKQGQTYEMRGDTRARGRNADIEVKIRQVMVGRTAGAKHGYLHKGVIARGTPTDTERLRHRFWALNPEHAPEDFLAAQRGKPTARSRPPRSQGSSSSSEASEARTRRRRRKDTPSAVSGAQRRRRSRRRKLSAVIATGPERARAAERAPEPAVRAPEPEQSRPPERTPSADPRLTPPEDRAARTVPVLGPGDPPSVLLRFPTSAGMRADLRVTAGEAVFFLAPETRLQPGDEVMLHIQLPQGNFVQAAAILRQSGPLGCIIEARELPPAIRHALETALQGS